MPFTAISNGCDCDVVIWAHKDAILQDFPQIVLYTSSKERTSFSFILPGKVFYRLPGDTLKKSKNT